MKIKKNYFLAIAVGVALLGWLLFFKRSGMDARDVVAVQEGNILQQDYRAVDGSLVFEGSDSDGRVGLRENDYAVRKVTPLLNSAWMVNSEYLESVGVVGDGVDHVQDAVYDFKLSMENEFAKNAKFNERESNADDGCFVYDVKSFHCKSENIQMKFVDSLSGYVGSELADLLLKGVVEDSFIHALKPLGDFGKLQTKIIFFDTLDDGEMVRSVRYVYYDPIIGQKKSSASVALDVFKERFGGSFDVPE